MSKKDYLNYASDLRRIADWIGRDKREKRDIIKKLVVSARKNDEVYQILSHFKADLNPEEVFNDEKKRLFFAEQILISSSRLEHLQG